MIYNPVGIINIGEGGVSPPGAHPPTSTTTLPSFPCKFLFSVLTSVQEPHHFYAALAPAPDKKLKKIRLLSKLKSVLVFKVFFLLFLLLRRNENLEKYPLQMILF
jgi:hypothetical protein